MSSLQRGVVYKINTFDDKEEDYYQTLRDIATCRRLRKIYYKDPNDMDQRDVSEIFGDVLRSLDHWKANQHGY